MALFHAKVKSNELNVGGFLSFEFVKSGNFASFFPTFSLSSLNRGSYGNPFQWRWRRVKSDEEEEENQIKTRPDERCDVYIFHSFIFSFSLSFSPSLNPLLFFSCCCSCCCRWTPAPSSTWRLCRTHRTVTTPAHRTIVAEPLNVWRLHQ